MGLRWTHKQKFQMKLTCIIHKRGWLVQVEWKWCDGFSRDNLNFATPLWAKWENATPTPKSGDLESSGTLENSEDDLRGQISSHWCVLYINGKLLKCKCPKWARIAHLNIYKLWAKEGPGVKVLVWLPTTKSLESTSSQRRLKECDTALESSRREL
jgi:hypothetical protein